VLAAAARLRRREDFTATVRGGRRASRGALVVHVMTGDSATPDPHTAATDGRPPTGRTDTGPVRVSGNPPPVRAGFVVSKAVGNAVTRNLVARRLRHLVRAHLDSLPPGTDLVVRALPAAATRTYHELEADLRDGFAAAMRRRTRAGGDG
jgi:ribonuclease P protein component